MLAFFFPLDLRVLAFRYVAATAVRVFFLWLYGVRIGEVYAAVMPNPFALIRLSGYALDAVMPFVLGEGGIGVLTIFAATLLQFGFFLGLVRYAVWRFRPRLLMGLPVIGIQSDAGLLDGQRLRRPWGIIPAAMMFTTIVAAYLISGGLMFLFQGGGRWSRARSWAGSMESAGSWPLWIAIGLSILGIMWGFHYTKRLKLTLGDGFGVQYLPPDHRLTQRVASLARKLALPPPAVGVTREVNAFACGPNPEEAAVILGIPLIKAYTAEELDAVIGHELGHIVSGDMRQMQIAEGFQSMFGNVFGVFMSVVGSLAASQIRDRSANLLARNASGAFNALGRYSIAIVSELMVKDLSRSREFHADAVGAALSSPAAMASALEKIGKIRSEPTRLESAYGYLMFRGSSFGNLFSTHPTFSQRKAALESRAYTSLLPRAPRSG